MGGGRAHPQELLLGALLLHSLECGSRMWVVGSLEPRKQDVPLVGAFVVLVNRGPQIP